MGEDKLAVKESRWATGVWIGIKDESSESLIGTLEGVIKVRTIRRKGSHDERWDPEIINNFKGVPWEPIPGVSGSEIRTRVIIEVRDPDEVSEPAARTWQPRRVKITKK